MNAYEARLTIARRAYQADAPSDVEVEAGVRRAMKSLSRTRRRDPARRIVTLGATALAFTAAVAWGVSGGFERRTESATGQRATELRGGVGQLSPARKAALEMLRQRVPLSPEGLPPLVEPQPNPQAAPLEAPVPAAGAATPAGTSGASQTRERGSTETSLAPSSSERNFGARRGAQSTASKSATRPSWSEVGEALERGDDDGARRALRELARRGDEPNTRAKAQLGLAQLAIAQGDCRKARAIAQSVARTPGLAEKVVARAHDLMLRCESE